MVQSARFVEATETIILLENPSYKISFFLNEYQVELFEIINFVSLSAVVCFFGIVGNIINIIVFLKQGFTNTVNISFLGLAISDLCCLISLLWVGLCINPLMNKLWVPMGSSEFQYLTGACPHGVCGRITSYITVYVTAERCLCILFPLKIKQLVTPTRTATVVCCIFIINFFTVFPDYLTSYLAWTFYPEQNKTFLVVVFRNGREQAVSIVYSMFFFTGVLSFVALITFTAILVVKLQQSSEWRKMATARIDQHSFATNREKRTVKMVVVIALIMIGCYTPGAALSVATMVEPEFYLHGRYSRLCRATWSIACVFNAVNSSINIFLYYKMSSSYKLLFRAMFRLTNTQRRSGASAVTGTHSYQSGGNGFESSSTQDFFKK